MASKWGGERSLVEYDWTKEVVNLALQTTVSISHVRGSMRRVQVTFSLCPLLLECNIWREV